MEAGNCCSRFYKRQLNLCNCTPISILNHFSEAFQFIVYGHVSHSLKQKLNPCQHGFSKAKYIVTNLVSPLVYSQLQADLFILSPCTGVFCTSAVY